MSKLTVTGQDSPHRCGKILCIGRNYALHAAEMSSPVPSEPLIFLKPSSAVISSGGTIELPSRSLDVHHEVELVVLISRAGRNIDPRKALDFVGGYAVGLDMTARDLQADAKAGGKPWSVAKGFDTFAPLGRFATAREIPDPQKLEITLTVNGVERQRGSTADMIFPVPVLISFCSGIFSLEPGDLIFTGTPAGVGPVLDGDHLTARVSGLPELCVDVRRS